MKRNPKHYFWNLVLQIWSSNWEVRRSSSAGFSSNDFGSATRRQQRECRGRVFPK
jgi:hypothetical protein